MNDYLGSGFWSLQFISDYFHVIPEHGGGHEIKVNESTKPAAFVLFIIFSKIDPSRFNFDPAVKRYYMYHCASTRSH